MPDTSDEQSPSAMPCHADSSGHAQVAEEPQDSLSTASPAAMDCASPCCAAQYQIPAPTAPRVDALATAILPPAQGLAVAQADPDARRWAVPREAPALCDPPPPPSRLLPDLSRRRALRLVVPLVSLPTPSARSHRFSDRPHRALSVRIRRARPSPRTRQHEHHRPADTTAVARPMNDAHGPSSDATDHSAGAPHAGHAMYSALHAADAMGSDGSGTGWLPPASPVEAIHGAAGGWTLMLHGAVFPRVTAQDALAAARAAAPRQAPQTGSWAARSARLRTTRNSPCAPMVSLDPITESGDGYPLLFQTGETFGGERWWTGSTRTTPSRSSRRRSRSASGRASVFVDGLSRRARARSGGVHAPPERPLLARRPSRTTGRTPRTSSGASPRQRSAGAVIAVFRRRRAARAECASGQPLGRCRTHKATIGQVVGRPDEDLALGGKDTEAKHHRRAVSGKQR